jgi:hypothetical protein
MTTFPFRSLLELVEAANEIFGPVTVEVLSGADSFPYDVVGGSLD